MEKNSRELISHGYRIAATPLLDGRNDKWQKHGGYAICHSEFRLVNTIIYCSRTGSDMGCVQTKSTDILSST